MITHRTSGDVAVLVPRLREVSVHNDIEALDAHIEDLAAAGNRHLVISLSDTKGCADDVSALLVKVRLRYDKLKGRVVVSDLTRDLTSCFRAWRIDQVIEVYETEAEALSSFIP